MNNFSGKSLDVTKHQVDYWIEANKFNESHKVSLFREHLANKPVCQWLGNWITAPEIDAKRIADHAKSNNSLYQVVVYNIPNRDAGGFSDGGAGSRANYLAWLNAVAIGLGSQEGLIIVEPDALGHAEEFDDCMKNNRLALLREAVILLRRKCENAHIYLDVGHPGWLSAETAAALFMKAGGRATNGISLNVSNSHRTESCFDYGKKITELVSGCHGMVIDTSRNGAGAPPSSVTGTARWANPPSNRLGDAPSFYVKASNNYNHRLHALLWVKVPGESDGECNGAPKAGIFWPEGAMRLIGANQISETSKQNGGSS